MTDPDPTPPTDPGSLLRSRQYQALLVIAAVIGLLVSLAAWGFLEAIYYIQHGVYDDLPPDLGFDSVPWWWPLPWLALAGALVTFAIQRLPGRGGHVPADGLAVGGAPPQPIDLPGVLLAALATIGLGLVLGPEAPLIALGTGLGILAIRLVRKDVPQQALGMMAAAGSFAAIASLFGSPVVGAVVIIEAAGLGGAMLPLILLPGLLAAGIGSLVFIGIGSWTGLPTSDYAIEPLELATFSTPSLADFGWTILLAVVVAVATVAVIRLARAVKHVVDKRPLVLTIAAALAVGGLAIAYSQATDESENTVLFSGQDAFGALVGPGADLALSTLALLLAFKGLAWALSLGSFRGGPTFPALFLGAVGGLLAAHLPGFSETPAVAVGMAAAAVAVLLLPLSCTIIVLIFVSGSGLGTSPLIIVSVVIAYLTAKLLSSRPTQETGDAATGAVAERGVSP